MAEPEDQRGSGSTSTAATAEQAVVDGGVLATVKDKRSNQVVTEHHGNPVKLEPGFARAEAHRKSYGHGEAHATAMLPVARKKSNGRRFPAKSSYQGRFAGCARNK